MADINPNSIVPAVFGLLGVIVGGCISAGKDWLVARANRNRQVGYLAVRLVTELDRLVVACAEIVADDGLNDGQRDENGYCRPQVPYPAFDPIRFEVDWKWLAPSVAFAILDLPYKIETAQRHASNEFEYGDGPPDFTDGFEARQIDFGQIGLEAHRLAADLRDFAGLPARKHETWNPVEFINSELEQLRCERMARARLADTLLDQNLDDGRANA